MLHSSVFPVAAPINYLTMLDYLDLMATGVSTRQIKLNPCEFLIQAGKKSFFLKFRNNVNG